MSEIIEVVQYRRDSLDHSFKSLQGKINKALQSMYEKATQELVSFYIYIYIIYIYQYFIPKKV